LQFWISVGLITACYNAEDSLQSDLNTQNSATIERNPTQVSLNSLEKAKYIIDNAHDNPFCSYNVENSINTPITLAFSTSKSDISNFSDSNNKTALSSTKLLKPRILEESNIINLQIGYSQNSKNSINESNFKCISLDNEKGITDESPVFMMANGRKAPSYSMNALTKAGIMMNNDVQNTTTILSYNDDNSLQDHSQLLDHSVFATLSHNNNVSKSSGFSTASGRSLAAVTEDSLIRARQTLSDNTSQILTYETVSPEFSIENNRNLSYISYESLNKARKSSRDNASIISNRNDDIINNSCFTTAGGQSITAISDESLKRVRRILDDDLSQNFILQEKSQNNIAGNYKWSN
jgi:hypothetical protein